MMGHNCFSRFPMRVSHDEEGNQGSIYWGGGGKLPPKSFTEKNLQLFQIKMFFDDDFKESVKITNDQKCDFSQS